MISFYIFLTPIPKSTIVEPGRPLPIHATREPSLVSLVVSYVLFRTNHLLILVETVHFHPRADLTWHWYFDNQDRLCTLPPLPSNGMHMAASPSCETSDSSPHSRTKIKGKASEYAYQFRDTPEGHRGSSSSSSTDHPQRMKTLFSKRTASWISTEGNRTMSQDNTRRENRSNDHREWGNHTRA